LAFLPRAPQYCRWTPTECFPCLGKLVSSKTKIPSGLAKVCQVLSIVAGELLVVPGALVDELLEGLLRVLDVQVWRESDATGEGFDALAFAVMEQPLEIDSAPGGLLLVGESVAEHVRIIPKSLEDFGRQFGCVSLAHDDHTNKGPEEFVGSNGVVLERVMNSSRTGDPPCGASGS
jgi:hypothetical protein